MARLVWKLYLAVIASLSHVALCRVCDQDLTNRTKHDYYFVSPQQFCYDNNYIGIATYSEGTTVPVEWVAGTIGNNVLALAQINASNPVHTIASNLDTTYTWDGCLPSGVSLSDGITFNFLLYNSSGWICSSDFFNVSATNVCAQRASASSSSAAVSASSLLSSIASSLGTSVTATAGLNTLSLSGTAASVTSTGTSGGSSSSSSRDESAGSGGSLSESAQIGIGVGVGVGGLLAIIGAVFFFRSRRQNKNRATNMSHSPPDDYRRSQHYSDNAPPTLSQNYGARPHEVHGQSAYYKQDAGYNKPYAYNQNPLELDGYAR